jgi:hypothetical protein
MPVVRQIVLPKKIHAVVSDPPDAQAHQVRDRLNLQIQQTKIECVPIGDLKPNRRNAKKHPERQIALLAENYGVFGFTQPVIVDEKNELIAGHARWQAALKVGVSHLPAIRLVNLSLAEKSAVALADNKLAELGEWDLELLQSELLTLFDTETELSFDPLITGFETPSLIKSCRTIRLQAARTRRTKPHRLTQRTYPLPPMATCGSAGSTSCAVDSY